MKKWNELSKGKKKIAIGLLILIAAMFIIGFNSLANEDNWKTTITCGDGKEYNFTGDDVSVEDVCPKVLMYKGEPIYTIEVNKG